MIHCTPTRFRLTLAALAAAAGAATTATADIQNAIYIAHNAFSYKVRHMPDLDQRRLLLPNQGAMYCVPTGTMNLLAYAADHGFPNLSPGDRNWQLAENYNDMTNLIYDFGELMGTDPQNGTGSPWPATYAWLFLNQAPLVTTHYYKTSTYIPRIHNLVKTAVDTKSVVAFAYGRYQYLTKLPGFITVGDRSSGHMVTLSEAQRFGDDIMIGVRDPADESQSGLYLVTQSAYSTRKFPDVQERLVFFDDGSFATSTLLQFPPSGSNVAIIDSYIAIRPMNGYGWSPSGGLFVAFALGPFLGGGGGGGSGPQVIQFEGQSLLIDAILSPETDSSYVLLAAAGVPTTLVCVNHADASQRTLATIPGAVEMVFGRNRKLYVMQSEHITSYDVDTGEAMEMMSAFVPAPPRGIAYDDAADEVLVLLPAVKQIARYRAALPDGVPPTVINIPASVPMEGKGTLTVSPVDGLIAFATETSHSIFVVNTNGPAGVDVQEIALPEITAPSSLSFNDMGDLFAKTADGVAQLRRNPFNSQWELVEDPLFAELNVPMSDFQVTCSRTNYDPAIHAQPDYLNFEPSENDDLFSTDFVELDCDADINDDGVVNGADLAEMLAAWGGCDICLADMDGDRMVNGADLAGLLAVWGACP